ncbi:hypothetical protein [Streptomyces tendae]|uniref:hypothetical protein n=1 Tax=Streptomyces tendae TaxID=1932 RepID=UPI003414A2C5
MNMITVKPERSRLVAFARWATAQTPKVGTVGLGEFGVPPALFVQAPEEVLVGALVDGHRYVSPSEDAALGRPAPGARLLDCGLCYEEDGQEVHPHPECPQGPALTGELLGVATPETLTGPGDPDADAAAMVAATPPDMVQRAMDAVRLATDLAASNAAAGGDRGDEHDQAHDFAPLEDAPTDDDGQDQDAADGPPYTCGLCGRDDFVTARGRDSHRRQVHRKD